MPVISLRVEGRDGGVLAANQSEDSVGLVYPAPYRPGDRIVLSVSGEGAYLMIQLDDAMDPAFVFMKRPEFVWRIPFGEERGSYSPRAFTGETHLLRARTAAPAEIRMPKNLAGNVYDCHGNDACFPHACANVETRGESVFAARNAIDGNAENHLHGRWPYESWGINRDPAAELRLDFGRPVEIDRVVLVTRADFPHDNWWKSAELRFSDGTVQTVAMEKSDRPHVFPVGPKRVSWLTLGRLIPDETDPSPFPALTQIAVYGTEAGSPAGEAE